MLKIKKIFLIARRIIDHCEYPLDFISKLNKLPKGSIIYLELNNYYELIRQNKFEILWNERTIYPTLYHIEYILQKNNLEILESKNITYDNSSLTYCIVKVKGNYKSNKKLNFNFENVLKTRTNDFVKKWNVYTEKWKSLLCWGNLSRK